MNTELIFTFLSVVVYISVHILVFWVKEKIRIGSEVEIYEKRVEIDLKYKVKR